METHRVERLLITALRSPESMANLPATDWDLLLRVARRAKVLGRLESDLVRLGLLEMIPPVLPTTFELHATSLPIEIR